MNTMDKNALPQSAQSKLRFFFEADINDAEIVTGGLFNFVARLQVNQKAYYFKQFNAQAKDPNFPPLPTTQQQRWRVAVECHQHARVTSEKTAALVTVPELVYFDPDDVFLVMGTVPGQPLFDKLAGSRLSDDLMNAGTEVLGWLRQFHLAKPANISEIQSASDLHKRYKVKLQYTDIVDHLPSEIHQPAKYFIDAAINNNDAILHGDINSRNILFDRMTGVSVIDFEQGQVGDPFYDVSYLCSEYVIAAIFSDLSVEHIIDHQWAGYHGQTLKNVSDTPWINFRIHLGFQCLYRLVGPSKIVWTGHLNAGQKDRLRKWSIDQLCIWLKQLSGISE